MFPSPVISISLSRAKLWARDIFFSLKKTFYHSSKVGLLEEDSIDFCERKPLFLFEF